MSHRSSRLLVETALFASIIALTTAYLFHIPLGSNGGYLHLGDAFLYLAASFLPKPYACAAGALGGILADLSSGAVMWMLPTALIKPLVALCFTAWGNKLICWRNLLALPAGAAISVLGYYVAEALIFGNWVAPMASMWGNLVQALGSSVIYLAAALALDRTGIKARLQSASAGTR